MRKLICLTAALLLAVLTFASCAKEEEHTHNFGEWETVEEETCTEGGLRERKCDCGETEQWKTDPENHAFESGICVRCGEVNELEYMQHFSMQFVGLEERADGTYEARVSGFSADEVVALAIPAEYNGKKITAIADEGLQDCEGLTSIILAEGITTIGVNAFKGCTALNTVELPQSLTTIEDQAFNNCRALKELHIPAGVTRIGSSILRYTGLEKITVDEKNVTYHSDGGCLIQTEQKLMVGGISGCTIPADGSVTAIDAYAMYGVFGFEEITIPDIVTTIGEQAFWACGNLVDVYLSASIVSMGKQVFGGSGMIELVTVHYDGTLDELNLIDPFYGWFSGSKTKLFIQTTDVQFHVVCDLKSTGELDPAPTCTEEGRVIYACFCGATDTMPVGAKGHDYENGVCTECGEAASE